MPDRELSHRRNTAQPSIMYYITAALGLSTLLTLTALLTVNFWLTRPVNLRAESDHLANVLEAAFIDNYVPPANIAIEGPTPESLERDGVETRWNAYNFKLTLPPRIKSDVLKDELRKEMSTHFARLVDIERSPETNHERFAMYIDDLPFATVELVPAAADANPTYRSDLRSASLQLANLVDTELAAIGASPPPLRGETEDREDLNAIWHYTHFNVQLPPGMTTGALRQLLEARNTLPDATFSADVQPGERVSLVANVAGKRCVGVDCGIASEMAAPRPATPAIMDEVLRDGIRGSEPVEDAGAPALAVGEPMAITPVPDVLIEPVTPVESEAPTGTAPAAEPVEPVESGTPLETIAPGAADLIEEPAAPEETGAPVEAPIPEASAPSAEPGESGERITVASRLNLPGNAVLPPAAARVAILIDDGGNNRAHGERFLALDNRLTLAILPNTPFGAEIAGLGAEKGFEIMLHMPMETDSETLPSVPGTVYTKMGKEEIQKLTNEAIDQIPYVVGINNHTGSKFTSDKKKMEFVLEVLKARGLYFIDSVTIHTTVAYETAREMGIPSARRDVFLDNSPDEASVRRQFGILVETALQQGVAIGIGHFQSPATARVLADEIPRLAEAGITLVHASELVQ